MWGKKKIGRITCICFLANAGVSVFFIQREDRRKKPTASVYVHRKVQCSMEYRSLSRKKVCGYEKVDTKPTLDDDAYIDIVN